MINQLGSLLRKQMFSTIFWFFARRRRYDRKNIINYKKLFRDLFYILSK